MVKKYNQLGFAPIVIILLLGLVGGSIFVAIRNNVATQVTPSPTPAASSAPSVTPSSKPSTSPTTKASPTPSPSATPTPTTSQASPASSSSPSPSPTPTSTPTSSPSTSPSPNTSNEIMSVDKTSVNVTIQRNGKTIGFLYGPYPSGVTIKSNNGSGFSVINDQGQSGVGIEGYGSSGLLPGQSRYLAPFITADKANGTYLGTNTIIYYDMQSKSSTGPTISYTIILTD